MGILYSVIPLGPVMEQWLDEQKVSYPRGTRARRATPREIWEAASALDGFVARYVEGDGSAQVSMDSADERLAHLVLFNVLNARGLDEPADFYIPKSSPEDFLPVLIRLSEHTGPLVVLADVDALPVVVTPDESVESLLAEWGHTNASRAKDGEPQ